MRNCLIVLFLVLSTTAATADSLQVNNTAALGGTGTACAGSNCGLEVFHDNSSSAYVRDDSPANESIYSASFLFDPNSIAATGDPGTSWRHLIFGLYGPNPNPGNFSCPGTVRIPLLKVFVFWRANSSYRLQGHVLGDRCGSRGIFFDTGPQRELVIADGPVKVCVELETGSSLAGRGRMTSVGVNDPCPTSADGGDWGWRDVSNGASSVDQARLGSLAVNNFTAGENGSYFVDEFQSFRTLSP